MADHSELEFFNGLSGKLEIELSEPPELITPTLPGNLKAPEKATIRSLRLRLEVWQDEKENFRDLTDSELAGVAYRGARIVLKSESGVLLKQRFEQVDGMTVSSGQGAQGMKVGKKMFAMFYKGDLDLTLPPASTS
jgi:hypothetical protein